VAQKSSRICSTYLPGLVESEYLLDGTHMLIEIQFKNERKKGEMDRYIKQNIITFRNFLLLACVVFVILGGVQVNFAATSLSAFTGTLTGQAPPPDEPLSLWYRQPATPVKPKTLSGSA
jgi:hypothetical protein